MHLYRINVRAVDGEPDTQDNSASIVYLVRGRDYATEELDDPWDMTEVSPGPAWYTTDIDSLTGSWCLYTDSITGMFEGTITYPDSANGLYLNTGSGSSDYIDADTYTNLSLAGRAQRATSITVRWIDSSHDTGYALLGDSLKATAADLGPYDLSILSEDWTGDIVKLWLEFGSTSVQERVRVGWVRLTE